MGAAGAVTRWFARPAAREWTCSPLSGGAREFHRALPEYAPTPLRPLPAVAAALGVARVLVKDESDRLGLPAFKALGVTWAVHRAFADRPGERARLVTATDGNHGRAVARSARLLGHCALVFVPRGVPGAPIAGEGAEVVAVDGGYDDAVACAAEAARAPGSLLVQDMGWPGYEEIPGWIVQGYGTLFAEVDAVVAADLVVVPVGVGSLAQAAVTHYRAAGRGTAVLAVEPATAACLHESLVRDELTSIHEGPTVMSGLHCATPSAMAWPVLRAGLDAAITVTDTEALTAAADLRAHGISSGPSGAASLAGARAALGDPGRRADLGITAASTVVLLNTEGARDQSP